MDYVLQSNPQAFKMLRAFHKLSFIKIDDTEDKALFDIILRENESNINNANENTIELNKNFHDKVLKSKVEDLRIPNQEIISYIKEKNKFKREMGLEFAIISALSENKYSEEFGNWDYLSHQVVASPFKPIDYMDKMDIFGYKYIPNYKTISKYLTMELKKDKAGKDVVDQIMRYVDWINQEYSHGDYDMIEAYIIANKFDSDIVDYAKEIVNRGFQKNKPALNKVWNNLSLYTYTIDDKNNLILKKL